MNFFKRNSFKPALTGFLATSVLLSSMIHVSAAASIKDLDASSNYAKPSIEKLIANGVIIGDQNGNFNPHHTITRAEMATMLVKALKADMGSIPETPTFKDVNVDHWGYKFVEAAYKNGLFKGVSEDMFDPEKPLSREEMAAIFIRAMGIKDNEIIGKQKPGLILQLSDKNKISDWAKEYIEFALDSGLMKGTGGTTFDADQNAEREQAVVMVDRVLENKDTFLKFHKTYIGDVEYSELYTALRNRAYSYVGDYKATASLKSVDHTANQTNGLKMDIAGYTNLTDFDVDVATTIEVSDQSPFTLKFRVLRAENKSYIKNEGASKWMVATTDDVAMSNDLQLSQLTLNGFLRNFADQQITKTENVIIEGKAATKYSVALTNENLKSLASTITNVEALAGTEASLEEVFNKGYEYKLEYYLNDKNEIIHEEVIFTGHIQMDETGENLSITGSLICDYSNIGKQLTISAPQ